MRRLAARGGTGIDHRHAGRCAKDMRHEHRALVLHLRQPLTQRRERIECPVRAQEDALGNAPRRRGVNACRRQSLHEGSAARA